jgi:hypothetical protein
MSLGPCLTFGSHVEIEVGETAAVSKTPLMIPNPYNSPLWVATLDRLAV